MTMPTNMQMMIKMMAGEDGDGVTDFCDGGYVTDNDANIAVTMAIPRMEDDEQHS